MGLREVILEIEDRGGSKQTLLYCSGLFGPSRKEARFADIKFRIHLVSDNVNTDQELKEHWISKAERFARVADPDP